MGNKYSLKKLQWAYLIAELTKNTKELERASCIYCWKHECDCTKYDVKNDEFLNNANELEIALMG